MTTDTLVRTSASARHLRTLTELDHARLQKLIERMPDDHTDGLTDALGQAQLVDPREIGPDVLTMYTRARVIDAATGRRQVFTLCYPADAEPARGFISVLSPAGMALIGSRIGERVSFCRPDGRVVDLQVAEILFQPEASGDYTT